MTETRPYLAEIGLANPRLSLTVTGITPGTPLQVDEYSPPRAVILEPRVGKNFYSADYERYLAELKQSGVHVEFKDIYSLEPAFWTSLSCSFLGLENVLNDPHYAGQKNFNALAQNASQTLVPGAFGFVYDSIPVPGNLYVYEGLKRELKRTGFQVLIDDMTPKDFKNTAASLEKSPGLWNDRMDLLAIGLVKLDSLDGPLTDALQQRQHGHWLVFQKRGPKR